MSRRRRRRRLPALALDDLEAWLAAQPDIARRNWTVSSLDGFCAALVAGQTRIAAEAWLRVIFGPSLPTTPTGLGAIQAVLEHHDVVSHMLRLDGGRRWRPFFMRPDDGTVLAQPWAAGFMFAVKRWPEEWQPMFESGDYVALVLPIIAREMPDEVDKLIAGRPPELREHVSRAYNRIPEAVSAIHGYWMRDVAAVQAER